VNVEEVPVTDRVEFYGPVDVYARREDGEWVAWADPFSEVGTGATFDDAVTDLQDNLEKYFTYVAEEMEKHGDSVQVLVPLGDDMKQAERKAHFFIYAVHAVASGETAAAPHRSRPSGVGQVVEALRSRHEVHVSPVLCQVG
jgi:hypothetical protein